MICIIDPVIKDIFKKFDPIKYMIIGKDSGELNDYFTITKSQKIDLYYFSTC